MGLAMIASLIGHGSMSMLSSITDTPPRLSNIDIATKTSNSGKCFIKNYGYYAPLKKYVAEVVCPDLDYCMMEVSETKVGLEENVARTYKYLEDKISESSHK